MEHVLLPNHYIHDITEEVQRRDGTDASRGAFSEPQELKIFCKSKLAFPRRGNPFVCLLRCLL